MPTYRGEKSVLIQPEGEQFAITYPTYDAASREYVHVLTKAQASKHGKAYLAEGLSEVEDEKGASASEKSTDES